MVSWCSCHNKSDYSAALKAIGICVWCVTMAGYFHSFGMTCEKMVDGASLQKAMYDFWRRADHTNDTVCHDQSAVSVMAYFFCYVTLMFVSCVGSFLICCGCKHYNKIYTIVLILCWIWLSVQDWWTLGAMLSYFKDVVAVDEFETDSEMGYLRNEYAFRIAAIWLAETFMFANSAWDAWDRTSDHEDGDHLNTTYKEPLV